MPSSLLMPVGIRELACELEGWSVPTATLPSHQTHIPGTLCCQEQEWKVPFFSPFHGFRTTNRQHRSVPVVHRLHHLQGQQGGHQGSPTARGLGWVTFETPYGLGSSGPLFGIATKLIIRVWMLSQKTANRRSGSSVLGARVR